MGALFAAVPPVVAIVLLGFRRSGLVAALVAVGVAGVLAALVFPRPLRTVVGGLLAGVPTLVEVGVIMVCGVVLTELLAAGGAQRRIADWVHAASPGRAEGVLLIVYGIGPFAESVTGFGIGVVVAVPLLRRLGLEPWRAAAVALLSFVLVPWGALAPGLLISARLTGVGLVGLGVRTGQMSAPVFLISGIAALVVAVGPRAVARVLPRVVVASAVMWAAIWVANLWFGPPPAGALAAAVTCGALLLWGRVAGRRRLPPARGLGRAMAPYGLLVGGLLAARLVSEAVGGALFAVLASPAFWLLVTCAATPLLLRMSGVRAPLANAWPRAWPVTATTVAFLLLGMVLTVTGMSAALAGALVGLGAAYAPVAVVLGAFSGFLTGSNAAAAAMFASSQVSAAHALGMAPVTLLAAQNVSASYATMTSASRVALAVGIAGMPDPGERDLVARGDDARGAGGLGERVGGVADGGDAAGGEGVPVRRVVAVTAVALSVGVVVLAAVMAVVA